MAINCGQTNIPTTEETPLPCDEFKSTKCILHEEAISYLSLDVNTPLDEVLEAYLNSLIDARNRIENLENGGNLSIREDTSTSYTLQVGDGNNAVSFDNTSPINILVPNDSTLEFETGTEIKLLNINSGVATITAASGVTFVSSIGANLNQGEAKSLIKLKPNVWFIKY